MTIAGLPPVSGVVLAGGSSRRFGRDKLAEPLMGEPLLAHALAAIARVSSEAIVAGPREPPPSRLGIPVRAVPDPRPDPGPLVGVLSALDAAREALALVVGGDMPRLEPSVLALLIRTLATAAGDPVDACVLAFEARIQPLPIVVRTTEGAVAARRGLDRGARSLYAWLDGLRVHAIPEAEWRLLDPTADTVLDIDREDDLRRLER